MGGGNSLNGLNVPERNWFSLGQNGANSCALLPLTDPEAVSKEEELCSLLIL